MGLGGSKPAKPAKEKKAKPAKVKKAKPAKGAKKGRKGAKKGRRTSKFEDEEYEDEDFLALAPAAFEGVAVQAGLRKPVSKFEDEDYEDEDYEDEDYEEDEYESDGEEGYDWQKYAPADFTNMATPTNMSLILLALLFIMIVLSRR